MIKKIIPVLAVIAAALIAISSGAFTSITAERTAEIYVAGDASALLTLAPFEGPNGAYTDYDEDGALYLSFEDLAAIGVNVDAITTFTNVFTITNNGSQVVTVTLDKSGDNAGSVNFGEVESGVELDVGETYTVSFAIDSYGLSEGANILSSITLTAEA
jgi:hypothetical protein